MINLRYIFAAIFMGTLCAGIFFSCTGESRENSGYTEQERSILIFSKTAAFRHGSIEVGKYALRDWAVNQGVSATLTEDSAYFAGEHLQNYDAVVFLNTSGTLFNQEQREAFKNYIRNGGGFAGVHAASDTEHEWEWYGRLVGTWFANHPPGTPEAEIIVTDREHLSTSMLPESWVRVDEWYNFKYIPDHVHILLEVNTDSYEGSDHPGNHAMAWFHEFEGGRSFFTGLGHTDASYSEELFMQHLWGGILYAMGE